MQRLTRGALLLLLSTAIQAVAKSSSLFIVTNPCIPLPEGCASDGIATTSGVPHTDKTKNIDVNAELDDWAALYMDSATNGPCLEKVTTRWTARLAAAGWSESGVSRQVLNRTQGSVDYYRQVYAGAIVTHIFATAKNLDHWHAALPSTIASTLADIRQRFGAIDSPQDAGCGLASLANHGGIDSCMDDHALTASGYAWIAAFEYQQRRPHAQWVSLARKELSDALSPMSDLTDATRGGGPCVQSMTSDDLRNCAGTMTSYNRDPLQFRIIGADHGIENPSYGIGMMPSIASACVGLFDAGAPCVFTTDEKTIARELMRTAQQVATPDGADWDHSGCLNFVDGSRAACGDETIAPPAETYRPTDFPVQYFYERQGISQPRRADTAFQFNHYCEPRTTYPPHYNKLWGPNRLTFYYTYTYRLFLPDVEPPHVDIVTPPAGMVSGRVTFGVNASDDHRVKTVAYYANGAERPFCTTSWPFQCVVDTSAGNVEGVYSVVARAFDDAGNSDVSASIRIVVRNRRPRWPFVLGLLVVSFVLVAIHFVRLWLTGSLSRTL